MTYKGHLYSFIDGISAWLVYRIKRIRERWHYKVKKRLVVFEDDTKGSILTVAFH